MKNRSGFTLIEVMVASACMVGALSLLLVFSLTLYRSWKDTASTMHTSLSLYAALSAVRRDLERAPRDLSQWYTHNPHEIAWPVAHSSRGLRLGLVDGRLERFEGTFDAKSHQWHTRSVSVLAQDIKDFTTTIYREQGAIEVVLTTSNGTKEKALIALGSGDFS